MTAAESFLFLRPWWLLALLLVPVVWRWYQRPRSGDDNHGWQRIIPDHLLTPLLPGNRAAHSESPGNHQQNLPTAPPLRHALSYPGALPALLVLIGTLALAGPSWRSTAAPLQQQDDALVIVLDLSLSMLATDVSPDRVTLARRKIHDLLRLRAGRLTGLVVYAGDAHTVAPLTDDLRTLEGMLPALDPLIMPVAGNRADRAITMATDLLNQNTARQGAILLITDGISDSTGQAIASALSGGHGNWRLHGLLVGTEAGGPIPLQNRGFVRDGDRIVMPPLAPEPLTTISRDSGGTTSRLTPGDTDLQALGLIDVRSGWQQADDSGTVSRRVDDGYWLLWAMIPLLALIRWRQTPLLFSLLVAGSLLAPPPAQAVSLSDLWQRPEQRGLELLQGDPAQAADRFSDPDWEASARFRSGDYPGALAAWDRALQQSPTDQHARIHYNRGNALAHDNQLEEAIEAWNQALAADPDYEPARHNRDLIEAMLNEPPAEDQQGEPGNSETDGSQAGAGQQGDDGDAGEQSGQQPQQEPGAEGSSNSAPSPAPRSPEAPAETRELADQNSQPGVDSSGEQDLPADDEAGEPGRDEAGSGSLTQTQEQWLRRIPDDPAGLLRRKFLQQSRQRNVQPDENDTPW